MGHVVVAWDRQGSEKEWKNFKKVMTQTLSSIASDDFSCEPSDIEFISTKSWVDKLVREDEELSLLLISESFDGRVLGTGSVKSWKKQKPELRIILVIADDRKGLAKLNGLYELGYYDALYSSDFNGENLARLIVRKRTKDRAFKYYGLEFFQAPPKGGGDATDMPDKDKTKKVPADISPAAAGSTDDGESASPDKAKAKDNLQKEKDTGSRKNSPAKDSGKKKSKDTKEVQENDEGTSVQIGKNEDGVSTGDVEASAQPAEITDEISTGEVHEDKDDAHEAEYSDIPGYDTLPDAGSRESEETVEDEGEILEEDFVSDESDEGDLENQVSDDVARFINYDDYGMDEGDSFDDEDFSEMGPQDDEEDLSSLKYLIPAGEHETVVSDIDEIIRKGEDAMYDFYHKCEAEAMHIEPLYPEMDTISRAQEELLYFFTREDPTWIKNYEQKLISRADFDQNLWQKIRTYGLSDEESREVFDRFSMFLYGYDIVDPFIHDPDVSDIKILRPDQINIKLKGKRYRSKIVFRSDDHYRGFVNQAMKRNHVLLNDNEPKKTFMDTTTCEDVRLRFVVSTEYVESSNLPAVVIRKESNTKKSFDELIEEGMMPIEVCVRLIDMARHGWSVIFSGEMASGKTTLYNTLLDYYSHSYSIQELQENEELFNNSHPNMMFERIQKSPDGKINFDLKYLAFFSLLEDVDIIGIGEIKGGEAKYFIDCIYANIIALASIHSPSARDALPRLADLAKYDSDYSVKDLLRRISTMKGVVVQLEKYKVREISRIAGWDEENGKILYEDIYVRKADRDEKNTR